MESPESPPDWLAAYTATLETKAPSTVDVYTRILHPFTAWLAGRPGSGGAFRPDQLTVTALDTYLEEHDVLRRNPARSVSVPPQPLDAPRVLDSDQRSVLRSLVERDGSPRSAAIFALGYWVGLITARSHV